MPQYKWIAEDTGGKLYSGKSSAFSTIELSRCLLQEQNLTLIKAWQLIPRTFLRPIPFVAKAQFFEQLSLLLTSGVLLPQALLLLEPYTKHPALKQVIADIALSVQKGLPFHAALAYYPTIFDTLIIQIVAAGEESGLFIESLLLLKKYLEMQSTFYRNLRAVLLLPIVTFIVFIGIALLIMMYIIPSFVSLVQISTQQLPSSTQTIMALSLFLQRIGPFNIGFFFIMVGVFMYALTKAQRTKKLRTWLSLQLPLVSSVVKTSSLMLFLQSTGLLVCAGIPLYQALLISTKNIGNDHIKKICQKVTEKVHHGESLHNALQSTAPNLFGRELIAMMSVAQESGQLGQALLLATTYYDEQLGRIFNRLVTVAQPLLLVILGLLIALLIAVVYLPIIQLPMTIATF